jgi:4-hydroxy-tetrahydrodipicolinate reductase
VMSLEVIICGVAGRMGGAVVRALQQTPGVNLVAAVDRPGSARVGKDAGEIAAAGSLGIRIDDSLPSRFTSDTVIIDFTNPASSLGFLRSAAKEKIPIVIGTTGFDQEQLVELKELARRTPTVFSANMSLGVNLLVSLLEKAAAILGDDYDVEIIETHHRYKKDAPSGTALALGRGVAKGLGRDLDNVAIFGRQGIINERPKNQIALLSLRAGDIVGEHTVIFGGIGERLEFIHRAHSRETFARGAIRASQWLVKRKPRLYSMQDVLGL